MTPAAVPCVVVAVDVVGSSDPDKTDDIHLATEDAVPELIRKAAGNARVDWRSCSWHSRGDGGVLVVPPGYADRAVGLLAPFLRAELRRYNSTRTRLARIRLRMAQHSGAVRQSQYDVSGRTMIDVARLVEAQPLRDALRDSAADLALLVSDVVYQDFVRHDVGLLAPEEFHPVDVRVKETRTRGWLVVPGESYTPPRPRDCDDPLGSPPAGPEPDPADPAEPRRAAQPAAAQCDGEPAVEGPAAYVARRMADVPGTDAEPTPLGWLLWQGVASMNGTRVVAEPAPAAADAAAELSAAERAESRSGRVNPDRLAHLEAVHVPPPYHQIALARLRRHHLVVLHGRAGGGRGTAGLMLAHLLGTAGVRLVAPDMDLRLADAETVRFDHGYLVDSVRPAMLAWMGGPQLARLVALLQERRSYLVVTVDERAVLGADIEPYVVECAAETPDPDRVLRRQLAWLLGPADGGPADRSPPAPPVLAAVNELCDRGWVRELLRPAMPPREVARLARVLEAVHRGRLTEAEAPARFGRFLRREVMVWLAGSTPVPAQAFRIALAVCNGERYQTVLRVARELERRLLPPPAPRAPGWGLLGADRESRLRDARAHLVGADERVEYVNPGYPAELLRAVWCEYDRDSAPLLDWLRELGSDPDLRVRVRAAVAVGTLAGFDSFGHVRAAVLEPWAAAAEPRCRESAAMALRSAAEDGPAAFLVLETLVAWSHADLVPELQATAAQAYGATVGALYPQRALRGLHGLASVEQPVVATAVVAALVALVEEGNAAQVLAALLDWTGTAPASARARVGRYAVLALAASPAPRPAEPGWPLLLWLVEQDPAALDPVATLLRRLLNTGHTREVAQRVRQRWVDAAGGDAGLGRPLGAVLAAVAARRSPGQLSVVGRPLVSGSSGPRVSGRGLPGRGLPGPASAGSGRTGPGRSRRAKAGGPELSPVEDTEPRARHRWLSWLAAAYRRR
jgi:hypothetical protein